MFNLRKLWEEPNKVVVRNSSNFIKPEKLNKVHKEHRLPQLLHIQLPKQFDNKIAVIAINDPRQGLDHIRLRHPEILTEKSKTPQITAEMARLALIIARTTQSIHEQRRYKKLLQTMNANLFKNYYNANIELFREMQQNLSGQNYMGKSLIEEEGKIISFQTYWSCINSRPGQKIVAVCFGTKNDYHQTSSNLRNHS